MNDKRLQKIEQLKAFLLGSEAVSFTPESTKEACYAEISGILLRFDYGQRTKSEKGVLRQYLQRVSGYGRSQITRLVSRWYKNRLATVPLLPRKREPARPFPKKYTAEDIQRLVEMDNAHASTCGQVIVHLFRRAYRTYQDERYARLAGLSVSHLYNLRKSPQYQRAAQLFCHTRPVKNAIGVRKAPSPDGHAGFVRIDTVHQGDKNGIKGVYHITCVDAVSQWQVEACVEGISEAFLLPVLSEILDQFPFVVMGFHSDNGSEYINHRVAALLEKLRIAQTKSRARHSNDNALAESKNANVVRKHMGYEHIPQRFAAPIHLFYKEVFNPWLNLHRPCLFATDVLLSKGKIVKRYRLAEVKTPLESLVILEALHKVRLKPHTRIADLETEAQKVSDLVATQAMLRAKSVLFGLFLKTKATLVTEQQEVA